MGSHSVDELVAHVVWAVQRRLPLLHEAHDSRRVELFHAKAADLGAGVLAAGCGSDHVHVLVRYPASRPLSEVVGQLKGASSRAEHIDRVGNRFAWQEGFWARSCSPGRLAELTAYILGQREHHRLHPGLELWARPPPVQS